MAEKQVKHDKYCWRCSCRNTRLKCSNCVRSFHKKCIPIDGRKVSKDDDWLCPVCAILEASENIDKKNDLEILPVLIDKLWNDDAFNVLKYPMENRIHDAIVIQSIVNPMDLSLIKLKTHFYNSFNEFYVDICWIVHNAIVLFSEIHENTKAARSLLNRVVEDIQLAKKCFKCYLNANQCPEQWFSMICDEPHLILWVKETGGIYWPAKLFGVHGQEVNVSLFGEHSSSTVQAKNCLLYSESSPNRIPQQPGAYNDAMKEANAYIQNLTKKFGSFRFAESKTAFNPALLEYYIAQLIPGSSYHQKMNNSLDTDDTLKSITEADTTCTDEEERHSQHSDISDANYSCSYGQGSMVETDFQGSFSSNQLEDPYIFID